MKCSRCPWAPTQSVAGDYNDCPFEEEYGIVWKDGEHGCTLHPNQIKKFEDEHDKDYGDMLFDMCVDDNLETKGIDKSKVIDYCKHMIGLDNRNPYHRHGKAFYRPYRNYWSGRCRELDAMPDYVVEKCAFRNPSVGHLEIDYHLTAEGKRWLGRQINITIKEEIK